MIKRAVLGLLALVLLLALGLALLLLGNTLRQGSRQVTVPPLAPLALDKAAIAESMAAAVRARTVSGLLDPTGVALEFDKLHQHLRTRYPLVHARLQREVFGSHSLLYTWQGSDPKAAPILLLAHQDVVPIAPGTEALWKKPPFDGVIEDGMVWGRGTLDNKGNTVTQLEAVEMLLQAGFQPRRSVYFVFGHDEEVGGQLGAVPIAAMLKQRGVKLEFVLDEGMAVTEGVLPGVTKPLALIGLGEKGSVSLRLRATAKPGHSSMPPGPGESAIGILSAALARVDAHPLPGGVAGAAAAMFEAIAPELPFGQRVAMSNLWLTKPLVEGMLSKGAATNAMMRTTTALTIVNAGNKENVLPGQADAVINFRILPGDSVASVTDFVKKTVNDPRIEITALSAGFEPSRLASPAVPQYKLIERTVREVFPDALVAPSLMLAASDARHFQDLTEQSYRFMPIRFTSADLQRVHGTDERIAVDQLADMVRFYHRLLSRAAQ
jgi:carboxypeptidase PM20D1